MKVSPERYSSTSSPSMSQGPSLTFGSPTVACFNRPSAPTRNASAPSGLLRSAGLMISGSVALSSWSLALQAPSTTPAARNTAARRKLSIYEFIGEYPSKSEIEAENEVGRWRNGLKIRCDVRRRTGVRVGLGVDAGVVRPLVKVAYGERRRRSLRREVPRRETLGERVRQRELAEAHERRVLHEADLRVRGIIAERNVARLPPEGRRLVAQLAAIISALATNAVRSVQLLEAPLVVEERLDAKASIQ